jgi:hypothetical protein
MLTDFSAARFSLGDCFMAEVPKAADDCGVPKNVEQMQAPQSKAGDPKIIAKMTQQADACSGILPPAELVADEKLLQGLYAKAIPDPNRQDIFSGRMKFIENYDPELFKKMVEIGQNIDANKPADQIGKQIAEALQGTVERHSDGSTPEDFTSPEFLKIMGGLSGLMLAERPTNNAMIDAAEQQLSKGNNKGIDPANGALMQLHAIRWADNGEPALSAYTNPAIDRYHFQLNGVDLKTGGVVISSPPKKP